MPSSTSATHSSPDPEPEEAEALAEGDQEQHRREQHRSPHVLLPGLSRVRALVEDLGGVCVQLGAALVVAVVVLRHEHRACRGPRVHEGMQREPGPEGRAELEAEALLIAAASRAWFVSRAWSQKLNVVAS